MYHEFDPLFVWEYNMRGGESQYAVHRCQTGASLCGRALFSDWLFTMVKIIFRDREWELPYGMAVRDAIRKVKLDPQAILAMRDGKLINEETITQENDVITLVSVVSGG